MQYNCVAVDDNSSNIELLSDYLKSIGNYKLVKSFTNPLTALNQISEKDQIDLIFIDIEMPEMSGIDLAKIIKGRVKYIIFTTAHSQYALDAFDLQADGFLLKPFSLNKFVSVLHNLEQKRLNFNKASFNFDDFFFIKNRNDKCKLVKVRYDEIIAIESLQNYVSIYTLNKTVVAHITLTKIKSLLSSKNAFLQVHRSFIISRNFVEEIDNNLIKMKSDLLLTIGESYKEGVVDFVKNKTIQTGRY